MQQSYPSTIFQPTEEDILNLWKTVATTNSMYGGIHSLHTINVSCLYEEIRFQEMQEASRIAFSLLNLLCEGCAGNHSVWWLAGGAAAYWKGKTNYYNDYDIYVCCEGLFKKVNKFHNLKIHHQRMRSGKVSVTNIVNKFWHVQLIPVSFPAIHNHNISAFEDFFGLYILANFDLPACRVALKFKIDDPAPMKAKCIDASAINQQSPELDYHRVLKYQLRHIHHTIEPPKLSLLSAFMKIIKTLQQRTTERSDN